MKSRTVVDYFFGEQKGVNSEISNICMFVHFLQSSHHLVQTIVFVRHKDFIDVVEQYVLRLKHIPKKKENLMATM